MRDVSRIPAILAGIEEYWTAHPDQRLAQVISNIAHFGGYDHINLFYCEDDVISDGLKHAR